ncbi:hypothetical protein [Caudoviricetes sp.]|nr:hypothetical protein [Caudoviricetes sp.]
MAVTLPSITQNGRFEPFELQVARGQITGHALTNVQGYNASHGTTFRAVWEKSDTTDYVYPPTSVTMAFTSSLSETLTLRVEGLDETYAAKTAIVTFTASTTGVVTSGTADFFRINAMQITKGTAADTVVATNNGTTYAQINPGTGRSQASILTVPLGYTFYLTRAQAFTTNNGAQFCTYRIWSRTFAAGVSTPNIVLSAPFTQAYSSTRVISRGYPEKTDVQWQLMQSNAAPGSIQLEGIMIKNDGSL